jgi:NAD(P)-dependent dehydrogenase (short-subunit alcohol dehydrogenase family)
MSANKVILVTGSNTGIGYEIVRLLAAKGHTVYLASRKESAGLEAVYTPFLPVHSADRLIWSYSAKIKNEKKLDVKFVQLDITNASSVQAAAAKIEKDEGRLNVLVNNAGALYSTPANFSAQS